MNKFLLLLTFIFLFTACFDESGEEGSGSGLFNGHKKAEDKFSSSPTVSNTYIETQNIDIPLIHDFPLTITGTPRLILDIGGSTVYANYFSGSGSRVITFRYQVQAGDNDNDGISITNNIDLNGGTIQFTSGGVTQNSTTSFPAINTTNVLVDTTDPSISSITPNPFGSYFFGETIQYLVTFDENVTISGSPLLEMNIGGSVKYANYLSGSGTQNIIFTRTISATDLDVDGLNLTSPLLANGGSLQDAAGNDANLNFVVTAPVQLVLDATFVDGDTPYVTSIIPPTSKTYLPAEAMEITLAFSETVNVTGTPRVSVDIGGTTKYFNYISGTGSSNLTFRYVVDNGLSDNDGIVLNNVIDLNGGTIQDGNPLNADLNLNPPMTPNVLVEGTIPVVTSIDVPSNNTYVQGNELYFVLNYNVAVNVTGGTPRLPIDVGGTIVYANYQAGTGTTALSFRYIVANGQDDANGIEIQNTLDTNGALMQSIYATNANSDISAAVGAATTTGILINAAGPQVSAAIIPPANANYLTTQNLDFTVPFSENAIVTGTPRIQLTIGSNTRYADYVSGTGTPNLLFRYTVIAADIDSDGIQVASTNIDLNGGTIQDSSTNNANLDLTNTAAIPSLTNVFTNGVVPTQLVITGQPTNTNNYTSIAPAITVEIRDASNNLVNTATNSVSVTFGTDPSAGSASIGGTISVNAVAGVATFSDLSIDEANTGYTFSFVSTGLTAATSNTFDITQSPATQLAFVQEPTDAVAGVDIAPSITVEIQDAGGNRVTSATDNITLAFNNNAGSGTLGGTLTVAAIAGVATFTDIDIDKAASGYTLDATATGLTLATSSGFNITPAAKAALAFVQDPTDANYNTNIAPAITVEIVDAFGNRTTDTDSITLAINNNPSAGTLGGTVSQAAVAGLATFNDIQIDNQGSGYTLDATATGLTLDTSASFNITAVPTQLVITQEPTNTTALQNITPAITVEVRDASNTLVTNATNSITVAIGTDPSAGAAALAGTLSVNAVAGIATFSDLNIDTANTGYTLDFTATGLTNDISNTFDITVVLPTVDITVAPAILDANKSAYTVSGNCSEDTRTVTIDIGGLGFTPSCSSGTYTTGAVDVSSLGDNASILITADHDDGTYNAIQATTNVVKDTDVPDINTNTIPASTYNLTQTITITLNFDQNVTVGGNPRIQMNLNSQSVNPLYATYAGGTGTSSLTFDYTIVAGDADPDGITIDTDFDLNGGSINDANGNPAVSTIPTTSFPSVLADSAVPSITSFVEPVDATYPDGVGLLFQVNFDEAVNITGSPRVNINMGGSTVYATYKTGSGTAGLEFEYIIQPGDSDNDGITLNSTSIDLNGGTIRGLDTDDAVLGFSLHLDSMAGVIVDTASGITPADQVTSLTAAPTTSNTELALSWAIPNDNGTAIVDYSVQYRQQGQSTWITYLPKPTTNQVTVGGLTAGITYEFRVAANNGLLGPYSTVATAEIFDVMSLDPVAWLDATNVNGNGTSPADGVKVASWVDLTGAASNATEAVAAEQPVMEYNAQNGLPAVRFDDHDRGLQGTFSRSNGTSLTFVIVGQYDSAYTDKCLFEFRNGGARGFFIDRRYASNTFYTPALTKGSFQMWTIENTGGNAIVTENGTTELFNGPILFNTDFTGTGNYTLGDDDSGGNRMHGYIGEFLVFDRALSAQDIATLETYLKNKWGTP